MGLHKHIVVNISRQILTAYDGPNPTYTFDCATGDSSNITPRGRFSISRKYRDYVSHKYHRRMNFAMFFHQGVAIHEAYAVGPVSYLKFAGADWFGSHGCVRLSGSDAQKLFDWAPLGTSVEVY